MALKPLSLGTRSNPGRVGAAGAARLINCFAEDAGGEGKIKWPLYAVDGLSTFATLTGGGAIRAMIEVNDVLYVCAGRVLFRVDTSGAGTIIGGVASDGRVSMARNRRVPNAEIGVVCDGLAQIIVNNVVTQISDADLPPANSIAALDGYFIFGHDSGRFTLSGIDDGGNIDPADFATGEANPDGLRCVATRGRDLVLLGTASLEFWHNTGGDFPFSRATAVELGCLSASSVATVEQTLVFVASDGTVRALNGYTPDRISTHAVERALDGVSDKSTIAATAWTRRGHSFYAVSASTFTWVCDLTTGLWHERASYGSSRWRVSVCAEQAGAVVAGSASTGVLYRLSDTAYDEAGDPLVMTVQTPPAHAFPRPLRIGAVYLDVVPGVGLNSSDAHTSDPQIMMDYSDDGGATWSSQRFASLGGIGETKRRVVFRRLGVTGEDGRTFRFSSSAAVVRGLTGAAIDAAALAP